jgi:hypothetical protein
MYITLTNIAEAHRGNKIAINTELIATVYEANAPGENGTLVPVTLVFCPPHGTWEVQESFTDVVTELNNLNWNNK